MKKEIPFLFGVGIISAVAIFIGIVSYHAAPSSLHSINNNPDVSQNSTNPRAELAATFGSTTYQITFSADDEKTITNDPQCGADFGSEYVGAYKLISSLAAKVVSTENAGVLYLPVDNAIDQPQLIMSASSTDAFIVISQNALCDGSAQYLTFYHLDQQGNLSQVKIVNANGNKSDPVLCANSSITTRYTKIVVGCYDNSSGNNIENYYSYISPNLILASPTPQEIIPTDPNARPRTGCSTVNGHIACY